MFVQCRAFEYEHICPLKTIYVTSLVRVRCTLVWIIGFIYVTCKLIVVSAISIMFFHTVRGARVLTKYTENQIAPMLQIETFKNHFHI